MRNIAIIFACLKLRCCSMNIYLYISVIYNFEFQHWYSGLEKHNASTCALAKIQYYENRIFSFDIHFSFTVFLLKM